MKQISKNLSGSNQNIKILTSSSINMRIQTLLPLPLISSILALPLIVSEIPSLSSTPLITGGSFTTRAIVMAQHLRASRLEEEIAYPHLESLTNTTTSIVEKSLPGALPNLLSAAPQLKGNLPVLFLLGLALLTTGVPSLLFAF